MQKLLLLFLLIKCLESSPRLDPIVMTPKGLIRGLQADDGDYAIYLGVPYAVVDPDNRFGPAKPHPDFDTTFEAFSDDVICPQYSNGAPVGDINCLNLNIYVPNSASPSNKLPVMFYVPGGAFRVGNGNRANVNPKYLIKHDVIIITINYRMGPYGFLCLDIPGHNNQGLKDQLKALDWVVDNIESFGGDAERITAFGQSAGAMTLDMLLLVKKPVFKRVILQSGTAISPWVVNFVNNSIPIDIAKNLGFVTTDVANAIDYLKTADVSEVIRIANEYGIQTLDYHPLTRPCVEIPDEDAILTDHPVSLKPLVQDMDIIIGYAFREASFLYPDSKESFYENYNFTVELARGFDEVLDEEDVRHFYIGDKEPSFSLRHEILDFGSDFRFVTPAERTVQRYMESNAGKVYTYMFTYEGGRNRNRVRWNLTSEGATHGDELGYLWGMDFLSEEPSESDQNMIDAMTKMWTDFAKYGDPTPAEPTELIPVKWRETQGVQRPCLHIDYPLSMEHRPFQQRMAFWDVYYKLHANNIIGFKK